MATSNGRDWWIRRSIDCLLSVAGLTVAAIPLGISAAAIALTSPGGVLYRQIRVGRGGQAFCLYKLRTMSVGSGGGQVTAAGDRRITPVGRVLRRLKIDELPQLWNVLKGDMTIIGPRPEVPKFVAYYDDRQREILAAAPGLAGLSTLVYAREAQVLQGAPDAEDAYVRYVMPKKIEVDLEYERTRSLGSDVRLMIDVLLLITGRSPRVDREFSLPSTGSRS